jgi:cytochrome c oxidase assembly protein subunit 15
MAALRDVTRYRQLAIITTAGVCLLTVAGGIVRLTGSGLGCDDWPNCNSERFVDVSSGHTAIEQINRLLSGVIGIPTLLLAIAAFRVRPQVSGLRWPAVGVLVSVLANGVVGGIAVRTDLHPALVQSHFLLAMVSIAFGMVAVHRSSLNAREPVSKSTNPPARVSKLALSLTVMTAAALVTGTVVTGTGPHAGEEDVRRFAFDISSVARLHSVTVLVALAVAAALAWTVRSGSGSRSAIRASLSAWIFVGSLQAVVGYTQYFNGVPELLVGLHIALATGLWVVTVRLLLTARAPGALEQDHQE